MAMATSIPNDNTHRTRTPFGALRRFVQEPIQTSTAALEHCELCGEPIPAEHRHLLEPANRTLLCTCNACAILFDKEGAAGGKYKVVPRRHLALTDFSMSDAEWDELQIPVDMAFLIRNGESKSVSAFYPGPAGATESLLKLIQWETLVGNNMILQDMACDVEALLINRVRGARTYYIVPVDVCYQLVGLMRSSWRGLSGGEAVWQALTTFFTHIQARARAVAATTAMKEVTDARSEL
jgi:hypothetical protein